MIRPYAHAIQTTWDLSVRPHPTRKNLADFMLLLGLAEREAHAAGSETFTPIIRALSKHTAASDTLTECEIEELTAMVNSLPTLSRRTGDENLGHESQVLLIDGYGTRARSLCTAMAQMSVNVELAANVEDVNRANLTATLIVIGSGVLEHPDLVASLSEILARLRTISTSPFQLIMAADYGLSFEQRLTATKLGAVRIFNPEDDPRSIRDLMASVASTAKIVGAKVLLIDDSPTDAYLACTFMRSEGLVVEHVSDLSRSLDAIREFKPDLVVMDYHMPVANGDVMASLIRQDSEMTMPIIFLSSESDSEKQLMAISQGADGFMLKPLQKGAFIMAIKSMIRRSKAIEHRLRRDPLTLLLNHSQIMEVAKRLVGSGDTGTIAVIDIDHFKSVNDTYGHPVGDRVLMKMAEVLTAGLRDTDSVGRVGGEEFAIVLPDTEPGTALLVLERIRECFMHIQHDAGDFGSFACSFSGGVATLANGVTAAVRDADEALYRAKHAGRNQIQVANP